MYCSGLGNHNPTRLFYLNGKEKTTEEMANEALFAQSSQINSLAFA